MRPPLLAGVLVAVCLLVSSRAAAQTPAAPDEPVRVRVLSSLSPTDATVAGVRGPLPIRIDGRPVGLVEGPVRLRATGSEVQVSGPGIETRGRRVEIGDGPARVQVGRTDRTYEGSFSVEVDGRTLQLVNHVPMTDYVASVVASEYPFTEIEGIKAQAILARTYALRRRGAQPAYDVEDDQRSQVYHGMGAETARSRQAARETAGEVLVYQGELAEAVYSSSSGGHTADNESIWTGAPVPYLRGVPDPYDAGSPDREWRTSIERDALHRALSRLYGGHVEDVQIEHQSREGRVLRVRLVGGGRSSITGPEFRRAANAAAGPRTVRSTQFRLSQEGSRYVFEGRGFGHGVGLSQYGARGQAQAGRSYREILAYYFQGTSVGIATASGPVPMVASTRPAFQAHPDDPVVRGSTEARQRPTPRRLARPVSTASEPESPSRSRRKGW